MLSGVSPGCPIHLFTVWHSSPFTRTGSLLICYGVELLLVSPPHTPNQIWEVDSPMVVSSHNFISVSLWNFLYFRNEFFLVCPALT
ncbi:hypothetical protein AQUCO_11400008v1 [Aquilegia coerulea]|uniref:Uncharacterized protein n=1 Tax=Aquilegia coerulea TaxID=218851 RepID=A0A2G5C2A6_AQUCA|nr:hypothetical protein AQUCO_11400008v1 [Aquilegia coerulea]